MISERLRTLREEFRKGQQQLAMLEQRRTEVRETLLRISGAIQVLEELENRMPVEDSGGEPDQCRPAA